MAFTAFWAVAESGAVTVTVPASLSYWAAAPVTVEIALSTPLTQLPQQRWTLVSLTVVLAAWTEQASAATIDAIVRSFFIMSFENVVPALDEIQAFLFSIFPSALLLCLIGAAGQCTRGFCPSG